MSQEMIAALITSGCIAVLVLWIPAICLTRHCIRTLQARRHPTVPAHHDEEMDRVSTYLLSGCRHEQE